MQYHDPNIVLDDWERFAFRVLLDPQPSDSAGAPAAARELLATRFGALMDALVSKELADTPATKGLPPEALARIDAAMERADDVGTEGRNPGGSEIQHRIEWDPARQVTVVRPAQEPPPRRSRATPAED